jgi:beta-glucuronidase
MLRTFAEHQVRQVISLDGLWGFVATSSEAPAGWTNEHPVLVPGAWETLPGLESYRGQARYSRTLEWPLPGTARLVFGGVSHTACVAVDGQFVGEHYDAFTPWEVLIPHLAAGQHSLVVDVDNAFGEHSALHKENDYFTYGGITRPVELQRLPDIHIVRVLVRPIRQMDGWTLDVRVVVRNVGTVEGCRNVQARIAGTLIELGPVTVAAGASVELHQTSVVPGVMAWSAETPALYPLTAELLDGAMVVDDLIDRVGFRQVRLSGKQLLLNGRPLRLRGYNRHEDHALFGNALPVEAMMLDLQLLADLGCNFVRTAHYPNDLRFLDLCDELGVYVWEESHARGVEFTHPRFAEQIEASTREMLAWHYNRPCIVIWGCLNECDAVSEQGQHVYARVLQQIKDFDPHRQATYATHHRKADRCLKYADIISLNIYTGGLVGTLGEIEPVIQDLLVWIHSDSSGGGLGKPVIMSEFGAEALYGNRGRLRNHWSEEYQTAVLDECLRVYLNHPDIVGAAIWQFCDCRVTESNFKWRPRSYNNKGTLDEYRRPKLAYEAVRRRMREARDRWEG